MDLTASDYITSAIALAALIVSVWTRIGARRDARRAAEAAERSAAASERTDRRNEEAAAAEAVNWRVQGSDAESNELVNDGPAPAYRVVVRMSALSSSGVPVSLGEWPVILRNAAVPKLLSLTGRPRDGSWVEVSWQLVDEDEAPRLKETLPLYQRPS